MKLKTEYNKETGKEQRNWLEGGTYDDEYVHWLHEKYFEISRKLEAGQHETIVMWRSVEDEVPDDFMGVLATDKRGRIYLAEWDGGNFIQTAEGEYAYDITHWATLPEPPQAT